MQLNDYVRYYDEYSQRYVYGIVTLINESRPGYVKVIFDGGDLNYDYYPISDLTIISYAEALKAGIAE